MIPTITAFERSRDRGRGLARDMRVRWALKKWASLTTFDFSRSCWRRCCGGPADRDQPLPRTPVQRAPAETNPFGYEDDEE
jgi:hypothetical protein